MARPNRYQLERVSDAPDWAQRLQDNLDRALERVSGDADSSSSSAATAAMASGTTYTPARAADWDGSPPSTIDEAVDRLAYHISSGAGTASIVELP